MMFLAIFSTSILSRAQFIDFYHHPWVLGLWCHVILLNLIKPMFHRPLTLSVPIGDTAVNELIAISFWLFIDIHWANLLHIFQPLSAVGLSCLIIDLFYLIIMTFVIPFFLFFNYGFFFYLFLGKVKSTVLGWLCFVGPTWI